MIGLAIMIASLTILAAALIDQRRDASELYASELRVRLARITEEGKTNVEALRAARQQAVIEAITKFPGRRNDISRLLAQLQEAVNERNIEAINRNLQSLRTILEPVFTSEIGDRPEVVALREDYEFWKRMALMILDAEVQRLRVKSSGNIITTAGTISIGDTSDDALPKLKTGVRLSFGFDGPDRTVESWQSRGGQVYRLTFERAPGAPFRVTRIDPE
jgi:hypothetical protein